VGYACGNVPGRWGPPAEMCRAGAGSVGDACGNVLRFAAAARLGRSCHDLATRGARPAESSADASGVQAWGTGLESRTQCAGAHRKARKRTYARCAGTKQELSRTLRARAQRSRRQARQRVSDTAGDFSQYIVSMCNILLQVDAGSGHDERTRTSSRLAHLAIQSACYELVQSDRQRPASTAKAISHRVSPPTGNANTLDLGGRRVLIPALNSSIRHALHRHV
jgi:hypothetical protein